MAELKRTRWLLTRLWHWPGPWPRFVSRWAGCTLCWLARYAPPHQFDEQLVAKLEHLGMTVHQRGRRVTVTGGKHSNVYSFEGAWIYPDPPDDGSADLQLRRILGYEGCPV